MSADLSISNVLSGNLEPTDTTDQSGQQQDGLASLELLSAAVANASRQEEGDDSNSSSGGSDGNETRSLGNLHTDQNGVRKDDEDAEESVTAVQGQSRCKRKQDEVVEPTDERSENERKRTTVAMCTLPTLPVEICTIILCFLGNAADLLHCEQTCRGLYQVFHSNDNAIFWKNCPGATVIYQHFAPMSYRERACVYFVRRQMRKEQKETKNIIGYCLGIPLWLKLINYLVNNHLNMDDEDDEEIRFHVRGDTSFVLMELVQQSLINHFELANCSILDDIEDTDSQGQYPVLSAEEFAQQPIHTSHRIGGIMTGSHWQSHPSDNSELNEYLAFSVMLEFPQLTMDHIEKMMRCISLRAGVARRSNEVYYLAWENAMGTIMSIITPACKQSLQLHSYRREYNKKTVIASHQSIRDVAPFPYYSLDADGYETNELNFVLVPKQLEEITFLPSTSTDDSSQLPWHARVYGSGWHVAIDSTRNDDIVQAQGQEILQAQEMYDFSLRGQERSQDNDDGDDYDDEDVDDVATDDDEMILPHTDEDAIILIVEDRLWFDDRSLVIEALHSLNKLVYSKSNETVEDNRQVAIRQGAPLAIVQAMRRNEDSLQIQLYGCRVLSNIALCMLYNARRDIIASGGVKACIRALARFQDYPALQSTGCNLIGNMWCNLKVRKDVAEADVLTAIFNAMNDHKDDSSVQEMGSYALYNLLRFDSSWAEATVNIGCIDAVIDSMERHRYAPIVQQRGCQFLGALAKSNNDYRNRIIDANGLTAFAKARWIHKDNAEVVNNAQEANNAIMNA